LIVDGTFTDEQNGLVTLTFRSLNSLCSLSFKGQGAFATQ